MRSLLTLLPFAASAAATTSILLPLYLYPGSDNVATPNAANWAPATAAIAAYPKVTWWVIVNPNSGPGFDTCPDENYKKGVAQLNSYSNVVTLGYVDTVWSQRAYQNVTGNVTTYAGWTQCPGGQDIHMDGIFFDDVPNKYDVTYGYPKGRSANDTYYRNITTFAYNTIPTDYTPIVLNTGSPAASEFYNYADILVEDEIAFADYQNQTTLSDLTNNQGAILNQSSIILHDVPTNLTTAKLNSLIHTVKANNVAFISMTQDTNYDHLNGTFLKLFASAVNSA